MKISQEKNGKSSKLQRIYKLASGFVLIPVEKNDKKK